MDLPLFSFISVLFTPIFIRSVSYPSGGALVRDARMPSFLVVIRRVPCSRDSNIPLTFKTVIVAQCLTTRHGVVRSKDPVS